MRRYNGPYRTRPSYTPRSVRRYEARARNRLLISIIVSITVLFVFTMWGLPTLIGGLATLNKFKNSDQITPTHEDAATAPPVLNIPFDATNSANLKFNGYTTPNSKVEIYIDDNLQTTSTADAGGNFTIDNLSLFLGANNIYGRTVNALGNKSLPSKTITLLYNNEKPNLTVNSPTDNQQTKGGDKKVVVSGTTDPQNSVTVNGMTVIVGSDGTFSTAINLNDGDNTIKVMTTDRFGNTNEVTRTVNYSAS